MQKRAAGDWGRRNINAYMKNILAMLIFGSVGIFVQMIPLSSSAIVAARTIMGSLLLAGILFVRRQKPDWMQVRKNMGMLVITGIVMGLNWMFLFIAYQYTSVSVATLAYYCAPVLVLFLSPVLLREKLRWPGLVGIVAAVIGMLLVNGAHTGGKDPVRGLVYGLLAAIFYAGVILLNKRITEVPVVEKTLMQLLAAGIVMGSYTLITEGSSLQVPQGKGLAALLVIGIVHTGIAYLLYISSMTELSGQTVALCSYIDPASALVFSAVFLQEHLTGTQLLGAALILGGSAFGELYRSKEEKVCMNIKRFKDRSSVLKCLFFLVRSALLISLTFRYPAMMGFLLVFLLKEGLKGMINVAAARSGRAVESSGMCERICRRAVDVAAVIILISAELSYLVVNILTVISIGCMVTEMVLFSGRHLNVQVKRRKIQKKVPAVLIISVLVLTYMVLGAILPFVRQPEVQKETKEALDINSFYGTESCGERAKVISDNGEALEERIRLILQAQEEVILSTFEFNADTSGKMIMAALGEAAERGVKVSVLVDGFPCVTDMWGNPYFLALAGMENVEIKIYNPVRLWEPWNLMGRLHDKYLIVDNTAYILGGRNTYDYFLGDWPGYKNYDWDVLVYSEGAKEKNSLQQVKEYFTNLWERPECRSFGKSMLSRYSPAVKKAGKEIKAQLPAMQKSYGAWFEKKDYEKITYPVQKIQLVSNPIHRYAKEPTVFYTLTELMQKAEKEVVFHTPYIICNDWMLERLEEVCKQTDSVRMMTNSVANNGNPFGAMDYQKYKKQILDTGVEIMEYDGGVSYHGKCMTIDDRISAVGSFNWDMRSAYLDTELMLVIDSTQINKQLRKEMDKYEKEALKVLDENTYDIPEGVTMQKISKKRETRIKILQILGWARFLM